MRILCLDLEGVLIPELWQAVAAATGVVELGKTTRDVPVYDDLMTLRLQALQTAGVPYKKIAAVISEVEPLAGALDFLNWARQHFQVAIVSDTFYEFGQPLMAKLGHPMLLCHHLQIEDGFIRGYRLRQTDPKRHTVKAFQSLGFAVCAAGDSFNDVSMLEQADHAAFYCAPDNVAAQYPKILRTHNYAELRAFLTGAEGP